MKKKLRYILNFRSIRTKMLLGFSLVLILILFLAVFTTFTLMRSNEGSEHIIDEQLPALLDNSDLSYNTAHSIALIRGYILYGNDEYKDEFNQIIKENKDLQENILNVNNDKGINNLFKMMNRWHEIINDEVIVPYESGNEDFARVALSSKVLPISEEILDRLEGLKEQQTDTIINIGNDNLSASEITLMMAIGVSILAIIVGIIIAIITANSITSPIRMVMERMKAMANGDLSIEPLETKLVDESGQLVEATNEMNENMRNLLMQVSEVSETVSSQSEELTQAANEVNAGSEQVATTMTEIADGTETQANHANQLSSAMGMFVSKIDEVNNNGIDMQASSNDVLEMTENGFSLMKASTTQMNTIHEIVRNAFSEVHKLSEQSQKIYELVNVIEDIAEQTNLLALNAAIEAARAGEHGQGFAVVADEVRKLAEGVTDSVTDITQIVTNIQNETRHVTSSLEEGYKEVEEGTEQIQETGETFNEISSAIEQMVDHINVITTHLTDMAKESEQMNSSVQEIAAVTEESAAGVEETTASAQQTSSAMQEVSASSNDLATLAEELNELVQRFKL